jgi:hypothetical protein
MSRDRMVGLPESYEMCIVGRGGDGYGASTADVGVAQLVGQLLQLVSFEPEPRDSWLNRLYFLGPFF